MTNTQQEELRPQALSGSEDLAYEDGEGDDVLTTAEAKLSKKRIETGNPLLTIPTIPSGAPLPRDAQRDFRGWITIVLIFLVIFAVVLTIAVVKSIGSRSIVYAPTAERIGAVTAVRAATPYEIRQQAQLLLLKMETWTPASVGTIWEELIPFLHPKLHDRMRKNYEALSLKAEQLWMSRVSIPLGVALTDEQAGSRACAIFFDSAEFTGRTDADRKWTGVTPKAAYVQFIYETPTKENPSGLVVTHYQVYDREAWLKTGFPDLWDKFRTKQVPKK